MGEIINWDGGFNGRLGGFLVGEITMEGILILIGNRKRLNNGRYKS